RSIRRDGGRAPGPLRRGGAPRRHRLLEHDLPADPGRQIRGHRPGRRRADDGDAGATEVPLIYTFAGGLPVQPTDLPVPYDTAPATCDKPTVTCETAYVCTGYGTAGIVTSYTPGKSLSFSITTPASTTIVNLDPTPLP